MFSSRPFAILGAALASLAVVSAARAETFAYTGAVQQYTVPTGVTQLSVTVVVGGSGGLGFNTRCTNRASQVTGVLPVTPGQVLDVYVGGAGGAADFRIAGRGGFNGGGDGAPSGGGGGGGSDIRTEGAGFPDRLVVAGGSGGSGWDVCGGEGGLNPSNGADSPLVGRGGFGGGAGTATAGGNGGAAGPTGCRGTDGSLGLGGTGASSLCFASSAGAGGGAGGLYGGGSGGRSDLLSGGGGGAGSSFAGGGATNVVISTAAARGDGQVVITPGPSTTISTPTNGGVYVVGQAVATTAAARGNGQVVVVGLPTGVDQRPCQRWRLRGRPIGGDHVHVHGGLGRTGARIVC